MVEEGQLPSPSIEEGSSNLLALDFVARPKSARTPNCLAPQAAHEPPPMPNSRSSPGRGLTLDIQDNMNTYSSIKSAPARNTRPLPSIPAPLPPMSTDFAFPTPKTAPVDTGTSDISPTSSSSPEEISPPKASSSTPSQPRKIRRLPKPPTSNGSGHLTVPSFSSGMSGPPLEAGPSTSTEPTTLPCKRKPLPLPGQPSSPTDQLPRRLSRHIPTQSLPSLVHPGAKANMPLSRSSTPPPCLPIALIPVAPLRPKSRIVSRIMNTALRIPPYRALSRVARGAGGTKSGNESEKGNGNRSVNGNGNGNGVGSGNVAAPPRPPTPPSPINSRARADRDGGIPRRRRPPGAPLPLKHARSTLLLQQPIRVNALRDDEDGTAGEEEDIEEASSWSDESDDDSILGEIDPEIGFATIMTAIPAFKASVTSLALGPGQRQTLVLTRRQSRMGPMVMMPAVPSLHVTAPPAEPPVAVDLGMDVKQSGEFNPVNTVNVNVEVMVHKDEGEVDYKWILAERKLIRKSVRNSGKWVWEKKGKRYTQRDYEQVMRVLRAL
ncbi:hypothetical protein BJ165DRAFT_149250 [Panaeolus papilionaceus]|nr:hypothetical protein BJ165DRAFT_149250 [Panaeolus papilionaceus]